ncbi:zinc finger protein 592 [Scleropages formosus]|uniref:C2H2-type domain-containing protein n=1 Tax=Scleropages formosus TaxID=113540 RepID=A0A8C9V4L9_SCLFO|nr:zinc finger protein 592 [Scleropages formosus]
MGDMKTPDFDDLLAAFDIPDATGLDAKEAIVESHDEAEGQPKSGVCMEDLSTHSCLPISDVPAVSVIVKNTSRQESCESNAERDGVHLGPLLQNGSAPDSHHMVYSSCGKPEATFANGDRLGNFSEIVISHRADKMPSFSQFSPISSPEPEDCPRNRVVGNLKQDDIPYLSSTSALGSADQSVLDSQGRLQGYSMFDKCHKSVAGNETVNNMERNAEFCRRESTCLEQPSGDADEFHVRKTSFFSSHTLILDDLQKKHLQEPKNFLSDSSMGLSCDGVKNSNSKLSSCLAALVALNAKKFSEDPKEELINSKDPLIDVKDSLKISPKVPKSPKSPRSPLEVVKRYVKPPDSPMSICSDSSGKASPSVTAGSPPVIPRVRIKTIKTSSGQIKRTVTSVLPDSELEELQSPAGSSPSQYTAVDEPSSKLSPVHLSHDAVAHVLENGSNKNADRHAARVMPSSTGSLVSSQGRAKKKGSAVRSASLHSTCSTDVRCVTEAQQQADSPQQTVGTQNTSFLPKAVHLANLNLVPHSVAASVTARCATQRQPQLSNTVVCSTVPLVHQVKGPEPRPCAAVPSTAVGTLNRLLNAANPVPTYVPNLNPPEHIQLSVPARGHRCLECGDSFSLEKSLSQHYSRRSVHIEVACTHCTKVLVFFNKCSLLAHARQHKSQGAVMQCTQFLMRPIAADQMFAPPLPGPSGTTQVVSVSAQSVRTPPQPPVMPLYPDKTLPHGMRCLECNKHVSDLQGLAGHYQRLSEDMEKWTCKVCMMMLPNKCSYKAHQRIHTHTSPYCCPECGALTRSMDIQRHVKENCLHYARKIGYKCSHCDMFQMSFRVQKSHIEEKHCEVFYKCSICPVAFKSSDGCLMHVKNKHNSKASPLMIYRCSCEMVFKRKQLLLQHFHQNGKKLTCCVFKCPECAVVFTQKQMLMQHFKGVHGGMFRTEGDDIHGATLMLNEPEAGSVSSRTDSANAKNPVTEGASRSRGLKNAGWTCGECLQWVPDRDAYVSHMKSNHSRSVKRYPCRQCERSFNSTMSLKRHIRNDHGTKRKMFTCWYCTDKAMTFTKHFMLKNHISLMHGIKNPDFSQMCKAPLPETSEASVEGSKAKRAAEEGLREASLEAPPAKRPALLFRCSKCGFTTEDGAVFQEHIPQHKSDDRTPQCLHCGLCFTSRLALSRHLLIVHKVKEPEESDEEPEELDEESPPLQDGAKEDASVAVGQSCCSREKASASLHCDTCSRAFDSESSYNSHMQAHSSCLTSGPEP